MTQWAEKSHGTEECGHESSSSLSKGANARGEEGNVYERVWSSNSFYLEFLRVSSEHKR